MMVRDYGATQKHAKALRSLSAEAAKRSGTALLAREHQHKTGGGGPRWRKDGGGPSTDDDRNFSRLMSVSAM